MNQKLIWFLGSNASGKTSQAKLLHEAIGDGPKVITNCEGYKAGIKLKYTTFGTTIGHVGVFGDNQCTGTDTINSKESLKYSLNYCHCSCEIVVVDGIMATSTWMDMFQKLLETDIYVILLQFPTLEQNLERVCQRRLLKQLEKDGETELSIDTFNQRVGMMMMNLEPKTLKNVRSKFKGFKSMYEKVKGGAEKYIELNAALPEDELHLKIMHFIDAQ